MELIRTKHGKIIKMSFVDAEHSNMSYDDFDFECEVAGIDLEQENPIALMIQFDGGFVNQTEKSKEATERFEKLISQLSSDSKKEILNWCEAWLDDKRHNNEMWRMNVDELISMFLKDLREMLDENE